MGASTVCVKTTHMRARGGLEPAGRPSFVALVNQFDTSFGGGFFSLFPLTHSIHALFPCPLSFSPYCENCLGSGLNLVVTPGPQAPLLSH